MKGILKKMMIAAAMLFLGAGLVSCSPDAGENTKDARLVILHTNDVHGFMEASDSCLGMEAVAQLKKDYEQQGCDVLLLDAGDMLQGNAFAGFS